jgi:hypothetical protein
LSANATLPPPLPNTSQNLTLLFAPLSKYIPTPIEKVMFVLLTAGQAFITQKPPPIAAELPLTVHFVKTGCEKLVQKTPPPLSLAELLTIVELIQFEDELSPT